MAFAKVQLDWKRLMYRPRESRGAQSATVAESCGIMTISPAVTRRMAMT